MIKIDINNHIINNIHLVGIGGISMSGIAEILMDWKYNVSGSDMNDSHIISKLSSLGAKCFIGHSPSNVENADLVIYTAAVKENNPEILRAKELNIPLMDRATALGQIMSKYQYPIAISGTHGKTTTTGIVSLLLEYGKMSPTILIGGELDAIGGNVKIGEQQYFVTEACEYVETFLKLKPYIGIVLNIEEDHLDYFTGLDHIVGAFNKFLELVPQDGYAVINGDDNTAVSVASSCKGRVLTFGINNNCNYTATNIEINEKGKTTFDLVYNGKNVGSITLSIPGIHNIYNSLAAIATVHSLGMDFEVIKANITKYTGTHRRFEIKASVNSILVVDDYAHHPTEIKATINATKQYNPNNLWCIFQPHTYTRTKSLLEQFGTAFSSHCNVIVTDIYAAREADTGEVHSRDLVDLLNKNGVKAVYIQDFQEISNHVVDRCTPGDMIITIGAGDVYKIGELIINELGSK